MTTQTFGGSLGAWRSTWPEPDWVAIEVERIRQDRGDLVGEVTVYATDTGRDEPIHAARLNLLSTRSRADLARYLETRTPAQGLDWATKLEAMCRQTVLAYREGDPPILLRDLPRPATSKRLLGDLVLDEHPTMWFGDGGAAKSWLALAAAAAINDGRDDLLGIEPTARRRVLYVDFELSADEHRDRLERLCGPEMGDMLYVRCDGALVDEIERLATIVRSERVGLVVIDSVAAACDGPPEAAEVAMRFARALRRLRVPALLIAHTNRSGDDSRPFGSTFWHNFARLSWLVKRSDEPGSDRISVGFFPRKSNVLAMPRATGFELLFGADGAVSIHSTDLAAVPDLAGRLPLRGRIISLLLGAGALEQHRIVEELNAEGDAVRMALKRGEDRVFTRIVGADGITRWGVLTRAG